ncbi:MAG: hypothetical protein R3F34_11115 [Planctomycetota bacterium]
MFLEDEFGGDDYDAARLEALGYPSKAFGFQRIGFVDAAADGAELRAVRFDFSRSEAVPAFVEVARYGGLPWATLRSVAFSSTIDGIATGSSTRGPSCCRSASHWLHRDTRRASTRVPFSSRDPSSTRHWNFGAGAIVLASGRFGDGALEMPFEGLDVNYGLDRRAPVMRIRRVRRRRRELRPEHVRDRHRCAPTWT